MALYPWEDGTARINNIPRDFHVLALVEVWSKQHANTIIKKYAKDYPFSYYVPATQGPNIGSLPSNPYCPYLGLPEEQCGATLAYGAINCLQAIGISTPTVLFTNLFTNVPAGPCFDIYSALLSTDAIAAACLVNELHLLPDGDGAYQAVSTCAAFQGHSFDFGGSPGLLLLSKHRIRDVKVQEFASFQTRKVVLSAQVNAVRIAFANFPYDLEIPAPFPSPAYALQQEFAEYMLGLGAVVLLGSFNSGPTYQPDAHNLLYGSGYGEILVADTFCTEALISGPRCARQLPMAIDHIYLNFNKWLPRLLQRVLTGVLFNNEPGLSPHAGVGLKLKIR